MKYICTKCKQEKERDDFFKDTQKKSGYRPDCKECNSKRSISWTKENPEKRKYYVLKSSTGVSKEDYNYLLNKQNNCCAICNMSIKDNKKRLAVDHCYITNLVRGLLCTKCNFGLGYFNDNIELLNKAIFYLNNNFLNENISYTPANTKRNEQRTFKKKT